MSTLDTYLDLELVGPNGPVVVPGDLPLPTPAEFVPIYRGPPGNDGQDGVAGLSVVVVASEAAIPVPPAPNTLYVVSA